MSRPCSLYRPFMAAAKKPPCEDCPNQFVTMLPCPAVWYSGLVVAGRAEAWPVISPSPAASVEVARPATASAPTAAAAPTSQRRRLRRGADDADDAIVDS